MTSTHATGRTGSKLRTAVHGMPRIGRHRELKWVLEGFWAGRVDVDELEATAASIRRENWELMAASGVDFVPSNDFSLYDHVLDAAVMVNAVPARLRPAEIASDLGAYFAMARGGEHDGQKVAPLDLTKWFDTNYHHLVPELTHETQFLPTPIKPLAELREAAALGIEATPVLMGPFSLLALSASAAAPFEVLELLDPLADAYTEILGDLARSGARWVRLEEPALVLDRSDEELAAFDRAYRHLTASEPRPPITVVTYFGHVGSAMQTLTELDVEGLAFDFCRGPENLQLLENAGGASGKVLFAGVIDGRNVWINDLGTSLVLLERLANLSEEVVVSTSCSLMHVPMSLTAEEALDQEVRSWLAFAEDKLGELDILARGASEGPEAVSHELATNRAVLADRSRSPRAIDPEVRRRSAAQAGIDPRRSADPVARAAEQKAQLGLPVLPTTTIGSFPQTRELRALRAAFRARRIDDATYEQLIGEEIDRVVALQEDLGLDMLVHGEPERDDMVRYFAAQLSGFVIPEEGWVQSYGSRCVRPPILYGDVSRPSALTVRWIQHAQARTAKPMKAVLTGPVTMLRWSFVRDDQSEADTAIQLALAMRDELVDLESAGIRVVQVDEPALREGLPLRHEARAAYLRWATRAFRIVSSAAHAGTQVHTHMCYSALGDITQALGELDVDVVSLEAARSGMALVGPLSATPYTGGVGPGVYDVHSPSVPTETELATLLRRAVEALGPERVWVNPDCGLKTRRYEETVPALRNMVAAAQEVRAGLSGS